MIGRKRRIEAKLDEILAELRANNTKQGETKMLIDDLIADVTAQTGVITSATTLLSSLSSQLAAAIASAQSAGAPPASLSQLQSLKSTIDSNTSALAAAVQANTPAAPAPAPGGSTPSSPTPAPSGGTTPPTS